MAEAKREERVPESAHLAEGVLGSDTLTHVLKYLPVRDALALRLSARVVAKDERAQTPFADFLARSARSDCCSGLWQLAAMKLPFAELSACGQARRHTIPTAQHQCNVQAAAAASAASESHPSANSSHNNSTANQTPELNTASVFSNHDSPFKFMSFVLRHDDLLVPAFRNGLLADDLRGELLWHGSRSRAQLSAPQSQAPIHEPLLAGGSQMDGDMDVEPPSRNAGNGQASTSESVDPNEEELEPVVGNSVAARERMPHQSTQEQQPRMQPQHLPASLDDEESEPHHLPGQPQDGDQEPTEEQIEDWFFAPDIPAMEYAWLTASNRYICKTLSVEIEELLRVTSRAAAPSPVKHQFESAREVIMWMTSQVIDGQKNLLEQLAPIARHASAAGAADVATLLSANDEKIRHTAAWTMLSMDANMLQCANLQSTIASAIADSSDCIRILAMRILDRLPGGIDQETVRCAPRLSLSAIEHALNQRKEVRTACVRVLCSLGMSSTCADIAASKLPNSSPSESVNVLQCLLECGDAAGRHTDTIVREIGCDDASTQSALCEKALKLLRRIGEREGENLLTRYTRILARNLQRSRWWHTRELLSEALLDVDSNALAGYKEVLRKIADSPLELWGVKANTQRVLLRVAN